jgi:hypothetical protein
MFRQTHTSMNSPNPSCAQSCMHSGIWSNNTSYATYKTCTLLGMTAVRCVPFAHDDVRIFVEGGQHFANTRRTPQRTSRKPTLRLHGACVVRCPRSRAHLLPVLVHVLVTKLPRGRHSMSVPTAPDLVYFVYMHRGDGIWTSTGVKNGGCIGFVV